MTHAKLGPSYDADAVRAASRFGLNYTTLMTSVIA